MRRKLPLIALVLLVLGIGAFFWFTRPLPVLTVTSWAGPYGRAQAASQMRAYASAKRVDVRLAQWDGTAKDLKGDVVDFELPAVVEACRKGQLEHIEDIALENPDDFVPGAIGPCWVGNNIYSQVIVYPLNTFPTAPATLADFWDTAKYPGKRALKKSSGKYNLEMALLADGVPPREVYATLTTDLGLARALHKIDTLNPNLVWYETDAQALELIRTGGAAFATALNGQLFDAVAHGGAPYAPKFGVIWDRQLYEMDAFAIPRGNEKRDMALDYIRFATGAGPLAKVASWVPYGPARRSAMGAQDNNPELGFVMAPYLPTSHFATAFAVDEEWWRVNNERVDFSWRNWLADPAH